jgi:hypothetical protein
MFAGMTSVLGIASSRVGGGFSSEPITDWFTTDSRGQTQTIFIPKRPGFTIARITCIGPGEKESSSVFYQTEGTYYSGRGGTGGNCSTSIVELGVNDSLSAYFDPSHAFFRKDAVNVVGASYGSVSMPDNLGDVIFRGGRGSGYNAYYPNGSSQSGAFLATAGGSPAGVFGDAINGTSGSGTGSDRLGTAGSRGPGFIWTDASTGKTATNGTGFSGGVTDAQLDFGGGSGSGGKTGRGLVVVEWGTRDLFI